MKPLIAYTVTPGLELAIVPAPAVRTWMYATRDAYANRCLPLLIANQAGWHILGRDTLRVTWDGGQALEALTIETLDGPGGLPYATSHFGQGIVTFTIPYLFRTPPGVNLLVRGPANCPVDGVTALDGLVETDWAPSTFTMNWKLTRRGLPVIFPRDEPIAFIVPMARGELESYEPAIRKLEDDPELAAAYGEWCASRRSFLRDLKVEGTEAREQEWQKDYLHGRSPDGKVAREHQRKLSLRPFRK